MYKIVVKQDDVMVLTEQNNLNSFHEELKYISDEGINVVKKYLKTNTHFLSVKNNTYDLSKIVDDEERVNVEALSVLNELPIMIEFDGIDNLDYYNQHNVKLNSQDKYLYISFTFKENDKVYHFEYEIKE